MKQWKIIRRIRRWKWHRSAEYHAAKKGFTDEVLFVGSPAGLEPYIRALNARSVVK